MHVSVGGGVDMHAQVVSLDTDVLVQVFEVLYEHSQLALFGVKHKVSSLLAYAYLHTLDCFMCVGVLLRVWLLL